jgi:[ribosomal protein S5]-alanine N-acetyltransferase
VVIETERLLLRPMEERDFDALLAMFTDPNVMAAFNLASFGRDDMRGWLDRNLAHQEAHGYGLFTVVLKATGAVIGDCGLEHGDFQGAACVELGYDLLSAHWNRGYATEAAARVRDLALGKLGIGRVELCSFIRVTNLASQRVSEKIGMRRILAYENRGTGYFRYGYTDASVERTGNAP